IETSDSGFLIAASSASFAGSGNKTAPRHFTDVWVLKLDSSGLRQWDQTYWDAGTVGAGYYVYEAADTYFVAGWMGSPDFTAWSGRVDKMTGLLITQRHYDSPVLIVTGMALADGGYWLGGGTYHSPSPGDFRLERIDALGNLTKSSPTVGGSGDDF